MSDFSFHPELFTHRQEAIDAMAEKGFALFEHFSSVDIDHGLFGLEVCGIAEKQDAAVILRILHRTFREWEYSDCFYRDYERDRGWKIVISRDPDSMDDFTTT